MLTFVHILAFLPGGITIYDFNKMKLNDDFENEFDFDPSLEEINSFFEEFGIQEHGSMNILKIDFDE